MLKYIQLGLLLSIVYLPEYREAALLTIATLTTLYCLLFYWTMFEVTSGLMTSKINVNIEVTEAWTSRVIQMGMVSVLFIVSGDFNYQIVAAFAIPWLAINTSTDTFATLVKWEILEIQDKEQ